MSAGGLDPVSVNVLACQKGQWARSGGGVSAGFEGGQNPIYRRIPKRGFKNFAQVNVGVVNLSDLEQFVDKTEVTPTLLVESWFSQKDRSTH